MRAPTLPEPSMTRSPLSLSGLRPTRALWWVVFIIVLLIYTVGLPERLTQLVLVMPMSGGYWSYLSIAEAATLTQLGIPIQAYFWALLSAELLLGYICIGVGGLIFWRSGKNLGAVICALMIMALGGSESSFTGSLARAHIGWFWARQLLQAVGIGSCLIVFYTFPDGRFVPRWTRPLAFIYLVIVLLWAWFPDLPFNPMPAASFGRTPILSVLHLFGWYTSGVIALTLRYRRHSSPLQRQQMKWAFFGLIFGFAVAFSHYGLSALDSTFHLFSSSSSVLLFVFLKHTLYWLGYGIVAISFGLALLHYRLWDIDLVIRRTLRYALWSAALLGAFGASVLLAQATVRAQLLQVPLLFSALFLVGGALFWRNVWARLQNWRWMRPAPPPPDEPPLPPVQLYGVTLLLARIVWLSLAAIVLAMMLGGAAPRLAALQQTSPPHPGGGLVLPVHLLPALEGWGLTLHGYAAWVFSIEVPVTSTFFLASALLFWRRSTDRGAFFVALLLLSFGATETAFGSGMATLLPFWHWPFELLQAIGAAMIIVVFCTFPDGRFTLPWARTLALSWCALVLVWLIFPELPFNIVNGDTFNRTPFLSLGFGLIWHLAALYALLHRYRAAQGAVRFQMQWMVYALAIVFVTTTARYTVDPILLRIPINAYPRWDVLRLMLLRPLYWLTLLVVPFSLTVAIMRYKLWGIETVIRRTLLYTALSLSLAGVAGFSIIVGQTLLRGLSGIDSELTAVLTTLLCVLLFEPLRRGLQASIDRRFDRSRPDFRPAVIAFSRELNQLHSIPELLGALLVRSADLLKIAYGALYLRTDDGTFQLALAQQTPPDTPPTLDPQAADQLKPDAAWHRPAEPRWPLVLPLTALRDGERAVIGALVLGPRRSEEPYSPTVIELLLTLAERTGSAVVVAQMVAYQLSPAGRAEALAQSLARAPTAAVSELHRLARSAFTSADEAARLAALPQALRTLDEPTLAELAGGYRLIVDSRDDPVLLLAGLRLIIGALGTQTSPDALRQPDAVPELYLLCYAALEIEQVAELGALLPRVRTFTVVPDDHSLALPLRGAITLFWRALQALEGLLQLDSPADQLFCLHQARAHLTQLEARLPAGLDPVERHIARQITIHWLTCIAARIQAIQGQSRLELRLVTRSIIMAAEALLGIELVNRGKGPARQITLQLQPGAGYLALEAEQRLDELGAGDTSILTFPIQLLGASLLRPSLQLAYADATQDDAQQIQRLQVAVLAVPPWSAALPNPYIAGIPLRPGSQLFFGRDADVAAIRRMLTRPLANAVIITGQRRMGKTSLLQQLGPRLAATHVAVYLDGQRLGIDPGMPRLFADLATRIARTVGIEPPAPALFATNPTDTFAEQFLPAALAAMNPRRLLLLIDEIEAIEARCLDGRLDPAFFDYLRHLMQHESRVAIILAGAHRLEELRPVGRTGSLNAALHHRLGGLREPDARALITGPLSEAVHFDALALDQMVRMSGGHPYFLQLLCQTLIDGVNERQHAVVLLEHVLAAREQILELGEASLADLWSDSTPDERLVLTALARMLPQTAATDGAQLATVLAGRGLMREPAALDAALQRLAWRDILAAEEDEGTAGGRRYRWSLALVRYWIVQTQTLTPDPDTLQSTAVGETGPAASPKGANR